MFSFWSTSSRSLQRVARLANSVPETLILAQIQEWILNQLQSLPSQHEKQVHKRVQLASRHPQNMSNHVTICEDLLALDTVPDETMEENSSLYLKHGGQKCSKYWFDKHMWYTRCNLHIGSHLLQAEATPLQDMRKKQYWDTTRVITPDELFNQQLVSHQILLEPWQL